MSAQRTAAERLMAERDALAQAITDQLYAEMPGLLERYGAEGRARCLEDLGFNLDHLAPAVELEAPEMFARYVRWLVELLEARGVGREEVARSLRLTDRLVAARFTADEAEAVSVCVRAGLAAVEAP